LIEKNSIYYIKILCNLIRKGVLRMDDRFAVAGAGVGFGGFEFILIIILLLLLVFPMFGAGAFFI
jgi:hypothetical protein